jgi:3-hydroxyacyl-[acyl-carrier-protein] dehydratase
MRFFFVDRLLAVDPGVAIEILKNVTTTEDVFEDHFPGHPIMPGALVVETFEQASQLLVALSHDFARVGRLTSVRRCAFRHFVRPGDQLRVRCARAGLDERRGARGEAVSGPAPSHWTIAASAEVDGRRVATATLDLALVPAEGADKEHAERLREVVRMLRASPIEPGGGPA